MEDYNPTSSANINAKWLDNIYDNIKKIEEYERIARDGCSSLIEYLGFPQRSRQVIIADAQYKTLRLMVSEFFLLIADLTPILKPETEKMANNLMISIENVIEERSLFIVESSNINGEIIDAKVTKFFNESLKYLHELKVLIFKEIKHILYIQSYNNKR